MTSPQGVFNLDLARLFVVQKADNGVCAQSRSRYYLPVVASLSARTAVPLATAIKKTLRS